MIGLLLSEKHELLIFTKAVRPTKTVVFICDLSRFNDYVGLLSASVPAKRFVCLCYYYYYYYY